MNLIEIIKNTVGNSFFITVVTTVLSGSIVFVLSNYYLESVLKPKSDLDREFARLSETFLLNQPKILANTLNDEDKSIFKEITSEIVSKAWRVYHSKKNRKKILEIARLINGINGRYETNLATSKMIIGYMKELSKKDKRLIISYDSSISQEKY